ncbi:MAG TPA: MFS transporter [Burkholderiaceae bacterium]|nr:MFS transporter [Burkholderiaceae bacterium]
MSAAINAEQATDRNVSVSLLLNAAHALDHLVLLIFAAAVGAIAGDFGFSRWEDLMPYTAGAFFAFGLGSLPAGRLGDTWGRRSMMVVFFFGIGAALLLVALTQSAVQMAVALTLVGLFASIYHPVGIPMLVQGSTRPGRTIGINGLAGNLGIALAALLTGLLVKYVGWRAAFAAPALLAFALGFLFLRVVPEETAPPARRAPSKGELPPGVVARAFAVITITATSASLIFNFTTNGNGEMLRERMQAIIADPAALGTLLAIVYTIASFAQLIVGRLIDRFPIKRLMLAIVAMQIPLFASAAYAQGWPFFVFAILFMVFVFGAIPFTDALIVRYVDDRMRSRAAGMRLAISFSISSVAVYLLGPLVKSSGFDFLLLSMAVIAMLTLGAAAWLPAVQKH